MVILNGNLEITEPDALTATVDKTDVTCNGGSDGSITITNPQGGTGSWEFSIDGGPSWDTITAYTGLLPATYNVMMRDAATPTCIVTLNGSLKITEPDVLNAVISSTDVTCNGGSDGTINITGATGGSGSYEFSIDGGTKWDPATSYTGLPADNYSIQIKDANATGCFIVLDNSYLVDEPAVLSATVTSTDVTECNGNNNGTITIASPAGGSGAYEYTIDGGKNWSGNGNFTGQIADTYDVEIRDANANGCFIVLNSSLVLNEPIELTADVAGTDVSCYNGNDGTITLSNAAGGSGNYEYTIDGETNWQSSAIFSNHIAGSYDVRIRDANFTWCERTVDSAFVINQPDTLTFTVTTTNISCNGTSDGTIELSGTGGNGTYEYSIDGGANWETNGSFVNLPAGFYDLAVKDVLGCVSVDTVTLTQPAALVINNVISNDLTCFGAGNGDIRILANGGTKPYVYSIDSTATFVDNGGYFSNLSAGWYHTAVMDANGCIDLVPYILIDEPDELVFDSVNITSSNLPWSG